MKKLVLLFGLSMFIFQSNAQNLEPIQIINGRFYQNDVKLKIGTVKKTVEPVPAAYQEVKSGASRITWGGILFVFGDLLAVTGAYDLIAGNNQVYDSKGEALQALGFGIALAIPSGLLFRSGSKRLVKGIDIYNSSLSLKSAPKTSSLNIGLSNHGVGLTIRF